MKRTLLATVAATALVAGTIAVAAQGMQGGGGAGGTGTGGGGAPSAAPAEKMGPPTGGGTTGQGTGSQMDRGSSGGQMDRGQSQGERGGQGAGERGQSGTTQNRDQTQPRTGQGEGSPKGQTGQTGQGGQDGVRQGQGGTNQKTGQGQTSTGSASLNTEQRTRIRETVLRGGNVNRVSNVNFNISVGTVVPRSVHLVAVPSTIVEVHPAWRGFLYFVVNDEIIIVEPGTLRIVAVIT
jgi:hypothetical protein